MTAEARSGEDNPFVLESIAVLTPNNSHSFRSLPPSPTPPFGNTQRFYVGMWNFCTLTHSQLVKFAFDM